MIKNTLVILFVSLMVLGTGCKKKELESLRQQNQDLSEQIEKKDSTITQLKQLNNRIEKNLQLIIQRRGIDSVVLQSLNRDKLSSRLKGLNEAMESKEKEVEALQNQLRGARYQAGQYKKQVNQLAGEVRSLEDSLKAINEDLMAKTQSIKKMTLEMETKDSTIADLQEKNEEYLESIRKKDEVMNTAYYSVGAEKDLQKDGVVIKVGGFLGFLGQTPVLNPEFNRADFETYQIPNGHDITIEAPKRKIELVTTHPDNSYTLKEPNDGTTVLTVTDEEQFWRAGKYLVVIY